MRRPDYDLVFKNRQKRFLKTIQSPQLIIGAKQYYRTRPIEFINDWGVTYDPRNIGTPYPTLMPFILFKRQKELVQFLYECLTGQENGAIEKCRDAGATWVCCNFSYWIYYFTEGGSVGWGSRKESLVDKLGDPDSIFEKIRIIIRNMPSFFIPEGYKEKEHTTYMKITNPQNGSTITGESGDNIGRGGRKSIYFKDESAHYERPEKIEAALGDNTNVQIDISSVNGPNTVFQRRVDSGENWLSDKIMTPGATRVFIFDWRDHPMKDQDWYDQRKRRAEQEGLLHLFAQEVDRDASSAVEGILIPPAWVKSAINAHEKLKLDTSGMMRSALDLSDEGRDKHAFSSRKGIVLRRCVDWAAGDVGDATRKSLHLATVDQSMTFQYDSIGVGAGAKAETNRLKKAKIVPAYMKILPWCATASPLKPNARVIPGDKASPRNKDYYANLKAQGWWELRSRFEKTHKVITDGDIFPDDELISISPRIYDLAGLSKELTQPTYSINGLGKIVVDKNPKGSKSPNRADVVMMNYWPVTHKKVLI
jgi:hypothetical protein